MTTIGITATCLRRTLPLLASAALFGGGLYLEVGNPQANPEARKLGAVLVARVTACHEPAKSNVTAALVRMNEGRIERLPLTVTHLAEGGTFAVTGVPAGDRAVIELTVTNPQFRDYAPRTLVRVDKGAIEWSSLKRYFGTPPRADEVNDLLAAGGA